MWFTSHLLFSPSPVRAEMPSAWVGWGWLGSGTPISPSSTMAPPGHWCGEGMNDTLFSFLAAVAHVLSCGYCCFSGQHHLDIGDSGPDVHGLAVSWGACVRSCKEGSAATLQCVAHDSSYPALVSFPHLFTNIGLGGGGCWDCGWLQ